MHPLVYDSDGSEEMYKISDFAEMTGLSKETLRYYAEVQLKASTNVSRRETLGNLYCGNISV